MLPNPIDLTKYKINRQSGNGSNPRRSSVLVAKRTWYATYRSMRFSRFLGFAKGGLT